MTSWMPQTWQDWGAFFLVFGTLAGLLYWLLRAKMGNDFMTTTQVLELHKQNVSTMEGLHKDHRDLVHRVANVEQVLSGLPTRADLRRTEEQVGNIASAVAKLTGTVEGVADGMNRNFSLLQILTRAQIDKDDK